MQYCVQLRFYVLRCCRLKYQLSKWIVSPVTVYQTISVLDKTAKNKVEQMGICCKWRTTDCHEWAEEVSWVYIIVWFSILLGWKCSVKCCKLYLCNKRCISLLISWILSSCVGNDVCLCFYCLKFAFQILITTISSL